MKDAKYLEARAADWELVWAAMHDERWTINIMDEDVPESFRDDVRKHWVLHLGELWAPAASGSAVAAVPPNVSSESIRRGEVDMIFVCGHMQVILT